MEFQVHKDQNTKVLMGLVYQIKTVDRFVMTCYITHYVFLKRHWNASNLFNNQTRDLDIQFSLIWGFFSWKSESCWKVGILHLYICLKFSALSQELVLIPVIRFERSFEIRYYKIYFPNPTGVKLLLRLITVLSKICFWLLQKVINFSKLYWCTLESIFSQSVTCSRVP